MKKAIILITAVLSIGLLTACGNDNTGSASKTQSSSKMINDGKLNVDGKVFHALKSHHNSANVTITYKAGAKVTVLDKDSDSISYAGNNGITLPKSGRVTIRIPAEFDQVDAKIKAVYKGHFKTATISITPAKTEKERAEANSKAESKQEKEDEASSASRAKVESEAEVREASESKAKAESEAVQKEKDAEAKKAEEYKAAHTPKENTLDGEYHRASMENYGSLESNSSDGYQLFKISPVFFIGLGVTDEKVTAVKIDAKKLPFDPAVDHEAILEHIHDFTSADSTLEKTLSSTDFVYKSPSLNKEYLVRYMLNSDGQVSVISIMHYPQS
ncbi:hypothetical protein [Lacticaseibacillus saniviri]